MNKENTVRESIKELVEINKELVETNNKIANALLAITNLIGNIITEDGKLMVVVSTSKKK